MEGGDAFLDPERTPLMDLMWYCPPPMSFWCGVIIGNLLAIGWDGGMTLGPHARGEFAVLTDG